MEALVAQSLQIWINFQEVTRVIKNEDLVVERRIKP